MSEQTHNRGNIIFSLNSNIIRYEEVEEEPTHNQNEKNTQEKNQLQTAHDWKPYRALRVFDDGTQTFFW